MWIRLARFAARHRLNGEPKHYPVGRSALYYDIQSCEVIRCGAAVNGGKKIQRGPRVYIVLFGLVILDICWILNITAWHTLVEAEVGF